MALAVVCWAAGSFFPGASAASQKIAFTPEEAAVRRLTGDQYRNIIHDVFGPTVDFGGHFEPGLKINGLAAVGSSSIGVTPSGLEQFDSMARVIADQVVSVPYRDQMIACKPASDRAADDACARKFLGEVGRLLYRRPLTAATLAAYSGAAKAAAEEFHDFYRGLSLSLAAMLSSPQFLFRDMVLEKDPDNRGGYRLDAYAKASELSFLLWNSGPDLELLTAAEKGELNSRKGLARQVDRMMASPRLEAGLRAFFIDNYGFDDFPDLVKDAILFPKFSAQAAADAKEQTLKTIVDLLLTQKGDYRDLFTTRKTFLTRELAAIYRVPLADEGPTGSPDSWQPYEFPADDKRAGILTHMSFTALHSPPGRGSPTIRGKAMREIVLCEKVPPPPGNVKFNVVQDTSNPLYKTARDRLTAHRTNPVCAGCHKIMDPIGLALENFDGSGEFRTTENGKAIDTSGEIDGVAFTDAVGLGRAVHDNPATTGCLVNRLSSYALGHVPTAGEADWILSLSQQFAANDYRVPDLMRDIVTSDYFYERALPGASVASDTPDKNAAAKVGEAETLK